MCLSFTVAQKRQEAPGILLPNWTFLFTQDKRYDCGNGKRSHTPGLFIYHPDGKTTFRSVKTAVRCIPKLSLNNPSVVADFNRHIGVTTPTEKGTTLGDSNGAGKAIVKPLSSSKAKGPVTAKKSAVSPKSAAVSKPAGSPMSLEELLKASCGDCLNCKKEDCGKCYSCISNRTSYRKEVCLQKVRR